MVLLERWRGIGRERGGEPVCVCDAKFVYTMQCVVGVNVCVRVVGMIVWCVSSPLDPHYVML